MQLVPRPMKDRAHWVPLSDGKTKTQWNNAKISEHQPWKAYKKLVEQKVFLNFPWSFLGCSLLFLSFSCFSRGFPTISKFFRSSCDSRAGVSKAGAGETGAEGGGRYWGGSPSPFKAGGPGGPDYPRILLGNRTIFLENPGIFLENPKICLENPGIFVENPKTF